MDAIRKITNSRAELTTDSLQPAGIKKIAKELTDAGRYSYAALCAISINQLFNNDWDKPFSEICLRKILKNVELPKQVEPLMEGLVSGEVSQPPQPYVDILKEEPKIVGNLSLVLYDLIIVAVEGGKYDARWRVLIRYMAHLFNSEFDLLDDYESSVVDCLSRIQPERSEEEVRGIQKRERVTRAKRYALIGLATVGGGALIGITGGLAAPLIGAGLGSVFGASAAIIGTATGVAVIGSLFGMAGGGLVGYKMHKRVGEIEEFSFGYLAPLTDRGESSRSNKGAFKNKTEETQIKRHLHITIAVSGWLRDEKPDNFLRPWLCLYSSKEQYYLRYESSYLLELGRAMDYILSCAVSVATQEILKHTLLSGLIAAVAWPAGLLGLANVIDNPWGVCCRRSAQVGKQLAEVLLSREQGQRPVTLVGYSLGARVIYYCLREMSEREGCEGIIEDAILIGAPCSGNSSEWQKFTRVVAGRIVNAYSHSDWLLRFLYRTLSMPTGGVAGLQPIDLKDRRMQNIDITHIIGGHSEYPDKINLILREIGIKVVSMDLPENTPKKSLSMENIPANAVKASEVTCLRKSQTEADISSITETTGTKKKSSLV